MFTLLGQNDANFIAMFQIFYMNLMYDYISKLLVCFQGSCSWLSLLGTCVLIGICFNEATSKTNNASTVQGHVEHVCPTSQTTHVSTTNGHIQPVCPTSQTNNVSTMHGHVQPLCSTSQTNNVSTTHGHVQHVYPTSQTNNASTGPEHDQKMYPNLKENNHSDSTVTEYADEKKLQTTPL